MFNVQLNNLQLLSEEIFDFSRGEMTQQKIKELKSSLNRLDLFSTCIFSWLPWRFCFIDCYSWTIFTWHSVFTSVLLITNFFLFSEFRLIHELCLYVLSATQRSELIRATLATLHAFLSWIPVGFIFESPLVDDCWTFKLLYVNVYEKLGLNLFLTFFLNLAGNTA